MMSSPNDYMTPALIRKDRYSAGQDMNSSIFWKVYYNLRSSSLLDTVPSQFIPDNAFIAYFSKICVFRPPTLQSFYTPLPVLSPNQLFIQLLSSSTPHLTKTSSTLLYYNYLSRKRSRKFHFSENLSLRVVRWHTQTHTNTEHTVRMIAVLRTPTIKCHSESTWYSVSIWRSRNCSVEAGSHQWF